MTFAKHHVYFVPNEQGWVLEVKKCMGTSKGRIRRNPIVIVPGYGMNSFIFGYHPEGLSMESYLQKRGFEVWSVNLREQGGSRNEGGSRRYGLKDLGTVDLKAAINFILKHTETGAKQVDLIGCSLGGTISFIYNSFVPRPKVGSIVAIGSPLRWESMHSLLKYAFSIPWLVGLIQVKNIRTWLRVLAPLILKTSLSKLYLHKEMVDTKHLELFFETVEDPNRYINAELARWMKNKDLILDGKNLTKALHKMKNPILCVLSNADGIVPPLTALSAHEVAGSMIKETLLVGTEKLRFAHADLFISHQAHDMVFRPIADWLMKMDQMKSKNKR